jgi:flagellar protein FlaI
MMDKYLITSDNVKAVVEVVDNPEDYVPSYILHSPMVGKGTKMVLDKVRDEILEGVPLDYNEIVDPRSMAEVKSKFSREAFKLLKQYFPDMSTERVNLLVGIILHEMLSVGDLELVLADSHLEEIVVNNSEDPLWVYHRSHGWLKTNVRIPSEKRIQDYASLIGRKVGRQITVLEPLMDAHLTTGDRINATLFPISSKGNTLTLRKFRRSPWTIVDLLKNKTVDIDVVALVWLAIEYELSLLIAGGTASGKTSLLNAILPFIPPNQRIISIEDTRELNLPQFLHWVPMTTRQKNPDGRGEVAMLDLLVNSLRQRPDRIIVGEIRRQKEAEVLFEAMNTGHSVYATIHANTAEHAFRRLTSPPIALPEAMVEALPLVVVQFRQRRMGIRRMFEIAEITPDQKSGVNVIYRWNPSVDKTTARNKSIRIYKELEMYSGLKRAQIDKDLEQRKTVLRWMMEKDVHDVNDVGKVVAEYYKKRKKLVDAIKSGVTPKKVLGGSV